LIEFPQDQIAELKALVTEVSTATEGGFTYFYLPKLRLPTGCISEHADALLCPMPRDGYESRMYFSEIVKPQGLNWHQKDIRILDRSWFAFSWKTNRSDIRLAQMVMEYLRAFK
tara:strand:+ start:3487 stop:3828 length:342 start_codon:yes stop_codon:yes gene_type:complete